MTLAELKKVCLAGETQFVEFKQYASKPHQIIEEVSGMLNAGGGNIYVGVKDDGEISGLKFAEDDINFLEREIKSTIKPEFGLSHQLIQVSRKRAVIVFNIPDGTEKPYRALDHDGQSSKIFYRVNDECIQASRELRGILRQAGREQGQKIVYSELEAAVLKEIDQAGRLSKKQILEKTEFNSRKISDCLIRLVTSKVLKIIPATSGDMFEYNHPGSVD